MTDKIRELAELREQAAYWTTQNTIDWDDAKDGSDGGYSGHGNFIVADAMKEIVVLRNLLSEAARENGWRPIKDCQQDQKLELWCANEYLTDHVVIGIINPMAYEPGVYIYFDDGDCSGMRPTDYAMYGRPLPLPPIKEPETGVEHE